MKYIITLLFLFPYFLFSQIISIPDPVFKEKLIEEGVDTNNDNEIQESEALVVLDLNLKPSPGDPKIYDLEGIQYFTNLTYLNCHGNLLTTINVNALTNLVEFSCASNQLTTLDVTALTNLEILKAYNNQLTSIDVTGLDQLLHLWVNNNQLESLDVSTLQNLDWLYCSNNLLTNLNISTLVNMKALWAHKNQLNTLNLNTINNLEHIVLHENNLTHIDVNHLSNLEVLNVDTNFLIALDITNLDILRELTVSNNYLSELDCSTTATQLINCSNNPDLYTINVQNDVISINDPMNADSGLFFSNLPSLEFICIDAEEEQALNNSGYNPETVTVYTGPNCTLSINVFSLNEVYIFPNPVNNYFSIHSQTEITNIIVYDSTGKILVRTKNNTYLEEFIPQLNIGVYFLKLEAALGNHKTIKLIKE